MDNQMKHQKLASFYVFLLSLSQSLSYLNFGFISALPNVDAVKRAVILQHCGGKFMFYFLVSYPICDALKPNGCLENEMTNED